jgi:hypothetical protein
MNDFWINIIKENMNNILAGSIPIILTSIIGALQSNSSIFKDKLSTRIKRRANFYFSSILLFVVFSITWILTDINMDISKFDFVMNLLVLINAILIIGISLKHKRTNRFIGFIQGLWVYKIREVAYFVHIIILAIVFSLLLIITLSDDRGFATQRDFIMIMVMIVILWLIYHEMNYFALNQLFSRDKIVRVIDKKGYIHNCTDVIKQKYQYRLVLEYTMNKRRYRIESIINIEDVDYIIAKKSEYI